jgi:hypothetical protein
MLATIARVGSMAASHRNMLSLWERAMLATIARVGSVAAIVQGCTGAAKGRSPRAASYMYPTSETPPRH